MKDKHTQNNEKCMSAAEPVAVMRRQDALDGMLAYITDLNVSAALRWELGHRLIAEAEHDMQVRPVFELERQLHELQQQADSENKPSWDTFDNAFLFINACQDAALLTKASVYLTDHATIMLKIILGETTSSVDIGQKEFTFAIVNTNTTSTKMGRGHADDQKSMKAFFKSLSR